MAGTPRTGALGVADAVAEIYVVDSVGELNKLEPGADEQVLISKAGAMNAAGDVVGLEWADIDELSRESIEGDAVDAVFKKVDLGGGAIDNPSTKSRGTHAVLEFDQDSVEGIPWQKYIGPNYSGDDLTLSIYWVKNGANAGDVVMAAAIERDNPTEIITTDNFAALQTAAAVAAGADGEIVKSTVAFTQAQADAIVAGDPLRVFIQRTGDAVEDTLDDPIQLVRWVLEENA
jgi:hypothetical protein